eukprot:TRINITY_DN10036_c0_g1_i3.p1 TRINITY_DN10036_c0_g1~~TRINITY_DN10036_c0_g1_i3.p1  ORF type:complete len:108 (-),score=15.06 TRINITY_DN10036_c0_g1_i3:75-398(-)
MEDNINAVFDSFEAALVSLEQRTLGTSNVLFNTSLIQPTTPTDHRKKFGEEFDNAFFDKLKHKMYLKRFKDSSHNSYFQLGIASLLLDSLPQNITPKLFPTLSPLVF